MIKHVLLVIVLALGSATITNLNAQDKVEATKTKTISLKKGQSLDLFNGIRKEGTDEAVQEYFGQVFPPASKHGFKVDGSFITIDIPTKGNYHSSFLSIMSWPGEDARNSFFEESKNMTYDFNHERKNIWSVFNFTEYGNLDQNIEFTVSSDKVYVITAYWVDDMTAFKNTKTNASQKMKAAGGTLKMLVGKGNSPSGYLYEPDVISITEWNSGDAFKEYLKSTDEGIADAGTKNVNQWITKFMFQ
jgi:hypothetical protein